VSRFIVNVPISTKNRNVCSASKNKSEADFADLRSAYDRMTEGRNIPLAMSATELLA